MNEDLAFGDDDFEDAAHYRLFDQTLASLSQRGGLGSGEREATTTAAAGDPPPYAAATAASSSSSSRRGTEGGGSFYMSLLEQQQYQEEQYQRRRDSQNSRRQQHPPPPPSPRRRHHLPPPPPDDPEREHPAATEAASGARRAASGGSRGSGGSSSMTSEEDRKLPARPRSGSFGTSAAAGGGVAVGMGGGGVRPGGVTRVDTAGVNAAANAYGSIGRAGGGGSNGGGAAATYGGGGGYPSLRRQSSFYKSLLESAAASSEGGKAERGGTRLPVESGPAREGGGAGCGTAMGLYEMPLKPSPQSRPAEDDWKTWDARPRDNGAFCDNDLAGRMGRLNVTDADSRAGSNAVVREQKAPPPQQPHPPAHSDRQSSFYRSLLVAEGGGGGGIGVASDPTPEELMAIAAQADSERRGDREPTTEELLAIANMSDADKDATPEELIAIANRGGGGGSGGAPAAAQRGGGGVVGDRGAAPPGLAADLTPEEIVAIADSTDAALNEALTPEEIMAIVNSSDAAKNEALTPEEILAIVARHEREAAAAASSEKKAAAAGGGGPAPPPPPPPVGPCPPKLVMGTSLMAEEVMAIANAASRTGGTDAQCCNPMRSPGTESGLSPEEIMAIAKAASGGNDSRDDGALTKAAADAMGLSPAEYEEQLRIMAKIKEDQEREALMRFRRGGGGGGGGASSSSADNAAAAGARADDDVVRRQAELMERIRAGEASSSRRCDRPLPPPPSSGAFHGDVGGAPLAAVYGGEARVEVAAGPPLPPPPAAAAAAGAGGSGSPRNVGEETDEERRMRIRRQREQLEDDRIRKETARAERGDRTTSHRPIGGTVTQVRTARPPDSRGPGDGSALNVAAASGGGGGGNGLADLNVSDEVLRRGNQDTWDAIANGEAHIVKCLGCKGRMQVARSASLVFCPICRTVSPTQTTISRQSSVQDEERAAFDESVSDALQRQEYLAMLRARGADVSATRACPDLDRNVVDRVNEKMSKYGGS